MGEASWSNSARSSRRPCAQQWASVSGASAVTSEVEEEEPATDEEAEEARRTSRSYPRGR
jgi:hypothetical protein